MAALSKRYVCDSDGDCHYTAWDLWARWVVLVLIIVFLVAAFWWCTRSAARRRRQHNLAPHYGTGWAARPYRTQAAHYQPQNFAPAPPQYSANVPPGHTLYGGTYGQQQTGIELQQPPQAYAAGRSTDGEVYSPPEGPPPSKRGK